MNNYPSIKKEFQKRELAGLLNAFISGNKRHLPKRMKRAFKSINLSHLFTPSGIHISSLYLLLTPLLRRFKNKLFFLIPFLGFAYAFTPFHSIKRILLLRTTKEWLKGKDIFIVFLISFLWDFILGTYSLSPMSFSYSFLFLGIILAMKDSPKIYLPLALFGGQVIAQFISPYPLTTTGFFWNFTLTGLFGLLYPFFFIGFFLPSIPLLEPTLSFFNTLVSSSSGIALELGTFMPTFNLVLLALYLSIGGRKTLVVALLILCSSGALFNSELKYLNKSNSKRFPYEHIERTRSGFTTWHTDRLCRHRHNPKGYFTKCSIDQ